MSSAQFSAPAQPAAAASDKGLESALSFIIGVVSMSWLTLFLAYMSGIDVWSEIIQLDSPLSLSPLTVAVFVVIVGFCWYGKDIAWFRYLTFGIFALLAAACVACGALLLADVAEKEKKR
jgi:uncharacterized membrane protein